MGAEFSYFIADLLGMEEWKLSIREYQTRQIPSYGKVFGGRQITQKRKSVHGRPTRRRLYKSH